MLRIRRIGLLGRAYRQFNRYRQILYVLFKYGFGDVIDMLKIDYYLEVGIHLISRKPSESVEKLTRAKRVRMVLEELGPTFIKLGQLLSSRSDLIPAEYHRELLKLQDQVPPTPYDQVREIIKSELGDYPEVLFHRFDETPLAGASIGSVHRAQLKSKEEVAIKIQRPGIRRQIETDLEIMFHLASLLERNIKEFKVHRPTLIVEEFAETLAKEIDYTMEASHIERFTRQLRNDKTVYVPKVYRHMSTEHVLTMEYIDGIKVSEIDTLREGGYDLGTIVERSASLIMKQLFVFGFFHADPHAGNIFVLPDNVICFLDFGMMGRVNREERENFTDMTLQVIRGEVKKVAVSMLKHTNYEKEPDRNQLERDLSALIDQHLYRPLKELDVAKLLHQLLT
ncbi:MAG: AarF/ABC1/UbiB kinase family protein, partial [Proteobacteria bacterium]|nr:AarF/ABC1/UbiB kinase family protein [Pseudomonadota bacterium]